MANTWWIVVPSLSEQNVQATPSDAIIAEVSDTSQQYRTWLNTDSGGAVYNGRTYYRRMGPFTSLAAAQQAYQAGAQDTSSPIPGVGITPSGGLTVHNPLTGWTHNIEQWLIRGFEMLLGLGLIIVAVAKLASDTPAGKAATSIATKAAIL